MLFRTFWYSSILQQKLQSSRENITLFNMKCNYFLFLRVMLHSWIRIGIPNPDLIIRTASKISTGTGYRTVCRHRYGYVTLPCTGTTFISLHLRICQTDVFFRCLSSSLYFSGRKYSSRRMRLETTGFDMLSAGCDMDTELKEGVSGFCSLQYNVHRVPYTVPI